MKWLPFIILLLLALNGCVHIPDVYVFEVLNQRLSIDPITKHEILTPSPTCVAKIQENSCMHGVSIMTGSEIFVGEKTLYKNKKASELQSESVLLPAIESYAPLETYIINSCKKMGCDSTVDQFKVKLDGLNGIAGAIKN
jgi:hypothetical protein